MLPPAVTSDDRPKLSPWRAAADVLLVFIVFAADGGWPVPDVNESHYLTKAKHYWEPGWASRDVYLASADSHVVFFATFGYLTHILPLPAAAWCGRIIEWGLLAWGWRRLSFVLVPRFGWAALTGAAALALNERLHMAGEWFVGGCEAKVAAYAFVFSGLADLVARRWNRALVQLGVASAFHVLVGGWSFTAAGFVWLVAGRERPKFLKWLPGLVVGGLISLAGLWPALNLSSGVDAATASEANRIYVYERLGHHLNARSMVAHFGLHVALLWIAWVLTCASISPTAGLRVLRRFTFAAGGIAVVGLAIGYLIPPDHRLSAGLLRFYWFRLADVMPAIGVSIELAAAAAATVQITVRRALLGGLALVAALHFGAVFVERSRAPFARGENLGYPENLETWRDVCRWIRETTPQDALFLTPRSFGTFTWYADRAEVAVWKNVPQDARSLVEWRRRLVELYPDRAVWLNFVPVERIRRFASENGVDYLVTYRLPPLAFPEVYANNDFVVYSLRADGADGAEVRESRAGD